MRRLLILFERDRTEKMKTWLLDVKILGEVLIVALMQVILVEVLITIMHV